MRFTPQYPLIDLGAHNIRIEVKEPHSFNTLQYLPTEHTHVLQVEVQSCIIKVNILLENIKLHILLEGPIEGISLLLELLNV